MCHDTCPRPVAGGAAVAESMLTISRDDAEIPALLAQLEDAPGPLPGVVLIHDIHGANDFYRDVARRLALEGYVVALPDLFHREGPPADDTREAVRARAARARQVDQLGDLETVARWLSARDDCTGAFGVVGFCMGGTLTFLLAARQPTPAAGVAFYGFPAKEATENAPVRPIDEPEVAAVAAPLLGLWGDEDAGVGMGNVDAYSEALTRHGKPCVFEVYPGAGHGFLTFDATAPAYQTSVDAWHRALAFLRDRLGETPAS